MKNLWTKTAWTAGLLLCAGTTTAVAQLRSDASVQTIELNGKAGGKRFDGIGIVNGGGATSVLLKDYPEKQRSEILDMVYRPKFGASVSALLVEIPGDGNSTQGSMPSHSHYRGDYNYGRGYTWWVLREAKKRNPRLSLDAAAWSAPGWVGNFWSQQGVDYYLSWLQGLRHVYGLELDAIGCRNERGVSYDFAKMLRRSLDENGFSKVKLHAFDNWPQDKLDFVKDMEKDTALARAIDIVSGHTFSTIPVTDEQQAVIKRLGKPVWNTEDHIYLKGFDCLIGIVEAFNRNYIQSGVTKIVNWYDIGGVYPLEPYAQDPPMLLAWEPWSGHYVVREALWGYAHYGQFTEVGWQYVDGACANLRDGGSVVTLRSPEGDYSVIAETRDAKVAQTVRFRLTKGMTRRKLCVWRSDEQQQFVRMDDIVPRGGSYTVTLEPHAVYSISTTGGQQKGGFAEIPQSRPFPLPYNDDFEQYAKPAQWGYLPHYLADILGCFELTERPDGQGMCVRQTVGQQTESWAPEWNYYTIVGDSAWNDYEVSADVWLNPQDEAGVMGRVCYVGTGYGSIAKGYYLKIDDRGVCRLVVTRGPVDKKKLTGDAEQQALLKKSHDLEEGGELVLDSAMVDGLTACRWHQLLLRFDGDTITGVVNGRKVVSAVRRQYPRGMAGLIAFKQQQRVSTPYFDNLKIVPIGRLQPTGAARTREIEPLYGPAAR
ncbi:MAG: galactosylceramidase [Prevotella sp.]|nr:galactosylceramidase [Prevotella sp.]